MGRQQFDLSRRHDQQPDAFAADSQIGVDADGAALRADDVVLLNKYPRQLLADRDSPQLDGELKGLDAGDDGPLRHA